MMNCFFCRTELDIDGNVERKDTCPHCNRDLRCCKQCKFYGPNAYNECREVSAERIVDKERANFCEYFIPKGSARKNVDKTVDAKRALEDLFRKK